jgi:hypothetical protein
VASTEEAGEDRNSIRKEKLRVDSFISPSASASIRVHDLIKALEHGFKFRVVAS